MNFARIIRILSIGYGGLFGLAHILHEHFCWIVRLRAGADPLLWREGRRSGEFCVSCVVSSGRRFQNLETWNSKPGVEKSRVISPIIICRRDGNSVIVRSLKPDDGFVLQNCDRLADEADSEPLIRSQNLRRFS